MVAPPGHDAVVDGDEPCVLTGAPLWCRWLKDCRCTRGAAGSSPCSLDASTSTISYARPGGTSGASAVLQPPTPQGCTSEHTGRYTILYQSDLGPDPTGPLQST